MSGLEQTVLEDSDTCPTLLNNIPFRELQRYLCEQDEWQTRTPFHTSTE